MIQQIVCRNNKENKYKKNNDFFISIPKIKNIAVFFCLIILACCAIFKTTVYATGSKDNFDTTAGFSDTKQKTVTTQCPGSYQVYYTYGPIGNGDECAEQHHNGCSSISGCTYYKCINFDDWHNQIVEWDCYGALKRHCGHECNGVWPGIEGYSGSGLKRTGTSRTRRSWTKCNVCGATELSGTQDHLTPWDVCEKNPGLGHYFQPSSDGIVRCTFCKKLGSSDYAGRCTRSFTHSRNVGWDTSVVYTDPKNQAKKDDLTGMDDQMIITKYNTEASVNVALSPNSVSGCVRGNIVGYSTIVNGTESKVNGTTDSKSSCYGYSVASWSENITELTTVQFHIYTTVGDYILPTVTLVPRFYWITYNLLDGGETIDGEASDDFDDGKTSDDMLSSGQASLGTYKDTNGKVCSSPRLGCYNSAVTIPNPTRPGFKFIGWVITNMDDGNKPYEEIDSHYHYWSTTTAEDNQSNPYQFKTQATDIAFDNFPQSSDGIKAFLNAKNVAYVPAEYTSFLNLRVDIGQHVCFTAIWQDNNTDAAPSTYGDNAEFGLTYINQEDGTNSDENLALATQSGAYTITRADGSKYTTSSITMNESYPNRFDTYVSSASVSSNTGSTHMPVYHTHTGSSSGGGGCYTNPVLHEHTESCYPYVIHHHTADCYEETKHHHSSPSGTYISFTTKDGSQKQYYLISGGCYTKKETISYADCEDAHTIEVVSIPSSETELEYDVNFKKCTVSIDGKETAGCLSKGQSYYNFDNLVQPGTKLIAFSEKSQTVYNGTNTYSDFDEMFRFTYKNDSGETVARIYYVPNYEGETGYVLGCGKTEETVDGQTLKCGYTEGEKVYHSEWIGSADLIPESIKNGTDKNWTVPDSETKIGLDKYQCQKTSADIDHYELGCGKTESTIEYYLPSSATPAKVIAEHVKFNQHANRFGTTINNQRYYTEDGIVEKFYKLFPNMFPWVEQYETARDDKTPIIAGTTMTIGDTNGWTSKTVTLDANVFDGVYADDGLGLTPAREGGSGIKQVKFDNDSWIVNDSSNTNNAAFSATKVFTKSGTYSGTVTIEDRAGASVESRYNVWLGSSDGNNVVTYKYGPIKIDKDKPEIVDPSKVKYNPTTDASDSDSAKTFRKEMYMMYEGYNDVRDTKKGDTYGWSNKNVRIVIYATDKHSGIAAQAYCWVPEGSGKSPDKASDWQSADAVRNYNGEMIPVSTRIVDKNEKGVVYVRDVVGNVEKIEYNVDHIDKKVPNVNPDKDPDEGQGQPVPVDPLDKDDDENVKYDPDKKEHYTWTTTGAIQYDWVNHNADVSFDAFDEAMMPSSESSGVWKMSLYRSDKDFTTTTENICDDDGKVITTRERAPGYESGDGKVAESEFSEQLNYTEERQGINYYILEVLDSAENLTSINVVVKVDKTAPTIPGGNAESKYWDIKQMDLDDYDIDKVEAAIQSEAFCKFDFSIDKTLDSSNGDITSEDDSSGLDRIRVTLINADDPTDYGWFDLYRWNHVLEHKPASHSVNEASDYQDASSSEKKETLENSTIMKESTVSGTSKSLVASSLADKSYCAGIFGSKLDTFAEFPEAAALNYEIEITDRAGNITKYKNTPGNEIKNFSVKTVLHSSEDTEFNIEETRTQTMAEGDTTTINKIEYLYSYKNRRNSVYETTRKLTDEEMAEKGLSFVNVVEKNITTTVSQTSEHSATKTSTPYFKTGDMGWMEVWTIGYVPTIQSDFKAMGQEMSNEIKAGRTPLKYNLGVTSSSDIGTYERKINSSQGNKIITNKKDYGSIPYASHYVGIKGSTPNEMKAYTSDDIADKDGWRDKGTLVRIPPYYALTPDGTQKKDQTDNYKSEVHVYDVNALKGNWKDTSSASYVLWDTRQADVHYRITHES